MTVLRRVNGWQDSQNRQAPLGWRHRCPGCDTNHVINVEQPTRGGAQWSFDGDELHPTFTPSVNIRTGHHCDVAPAASCERCAEAARDGRKSPCSVCHYFVRAGLIVYCADSTHALAGQTVPLPEIDG